MRINENESEVLKALYKKSEKKEEKKLPELYNLLINDDDLIDLAHPDEPKCIIPSYDILRGSISNSKQNQQVSVDLALRMPDGFNINRKYIKASQNLLNSLISVGFQLDAVGNEELAKIADQCAYQFEKKAAIPLMVWLAGAGITMGLTYLGVINNLGYINEGVLNNAKRAITELEEAKSSVPSLVSNIDNLIRGLNLLVSIAEQVMDVPSEMPKAIDFLTPSIDTARKGAEFAQSEQGKKKIEALTKYKNVCYKLSQHLPAYIQLLKSSKSVSQQNSSTRILAPLTTMWEWIWPPAVEDAWKALETLQKSLIDSYTEIQKHIDSIQNFVESNKVDIVKEMEAESGQTAPETKPKETLEDDLRKKLLE